MSSIATVWDVRLRMRRGIALARLTVAPDISLPRGALADPAGICEVLPGVRMIDAVGISRRADERLAQHARAAQALRGRSFVSWLAGCATQPENLGGLREALERFPVILATPLHVSVLALVGRLLLETQFRARRTPSAVFVQKTPLSEL